MYAIRRFFLLSENKRMVVAFVIAILFLLSCQGSHDYFVHPRGDKDRMKRGLAEQWTTRLHTYKGKGCLASIGSLVCTISYNIDEVPIFVSAQRVPFEGATEKEHLSWIRTDNDPAAWIFVNLQKRQARLSLPANEACRWLNKFPVRDQITYELYSGLRSNDQVVSVKELPFQTDHEFAMTVLAMIATNDPGFNAHMRDIAAQTTAISEFDRFMESRETHALVFTIAVLFILCCILPGGLKSLVQSTAENAGLEREQAAALYEAMKPHWLSGMSITRIEHRTLAMAKQLRREQDRAEDRKRREELRKHMDEAQAKKLADQAERQAKAARERLHAGQTSLGKEVAQFRKDIKSAGKQAGAVLESGFLRAVTRPRSGALHSGEGHIGDDEDDPRSEAEQSIMSCSQRLTPLDRFSDQQLQELAKLLRSVKRKLGRDQWRNLCDRFDPDQPATFLRFVGNIDANAQADVRQTGTSGRLPVLREQGEEAIPRLLERKRVILVGGDPGLSGFYEKQLQLLGATVLIHHVGGNPVRMRQYQPDLILMLWRRIDHKAQHMARSMGVDIIFLDKIARSSFLTGAIEDIREQLSL